MPVCLCDFKNAEVKVCPTLCAYVIFLVYYIGLHVKLETCGHNYQNSACTDVIKHLPETQYHIHALRC